MINGMYDISKILNENILYICGSRKDYSKISDDKDIKNVSSKFLDDVFDVLQGKKSQYVFDNIFGAVTNDKKIIIIDGREKITALFLLEWYLGIKSEAWNAGAFLDRLRYITNGESKNFFIFIMEYGLCIKRDEKPSDVIKKHIKFRKEWLNDSIVVIILNVLEDIDNRIVGDPKLLYSNIDKIKFSIYFQNY